MQAKPLLKHFAVFDFLDFLCFDKEIVFFLSESEPELQILFGFFLLFQLHEFSHFLA